MKSESVLHSTREQHTSCSSEHVDDLLSVTSAGHLKEQISATDPSEIALLWSSVCEEIRSRESATVHELVHKVPQSQWRPNNAGHTSVTPTIKPFRGSNKGGKLDTPTKRSRPQMTSNTILHGLSANIASSQVGRAPRWVSYDIRAYTIAIVSAHEYFDSKLEKPPTRAPAAPRGPSEPEKETQFYETVVIEYSFLVICQSSQDAFAQLTNDRFLQLSPLCRDIPTQEQPQAVKLNTSSTCHLHDEWQEPPEITGSRTTKPYSSPFACTFWLTKRIFDHPVRKYLDDYTYELGRKLVFPYLTVDFRHPDEQLHEARDRAARHGTQALLNRHRLFRKTRALAGKAAAGARDDALLRCCHFVIVFDAACSERWQISVADDGEEGGRVDGEKRQRCQQRVRDESHPLCVAAGGGRCQGSV